MKPVLLVLVLVNPGVEQRVRIVHELASSCEHRAEEWRRLASEHGRQAKAYCVPLPADGTGTQEWRAPKP